MQNIYLLHLCNIYKDFIDNKFLPTEEEDLSMREFTGAYNVTDAQAKILAYLLHCYPKYAFRYDLQRIQDRNNFLNVDDAIEDLYERGFIDKHQTGDDSFTYALRSDAICKIEKGTFFGKKIIPDCYKELKTVTLQKILVSGWKETFYESAEACKDKQIAEAISELGVKEWTQDIQDAFWSLVWRFANSFTAPFAFGGSNCPLSESGNTYDVPRIKRAMGELVNLGMAATIPIEPLEDTKETERYVIAVKVVELLFHGHEEFIRYEEIAKQANVIFAKDIIGKELFFTEKGQKDVDNLRKMLTPEGFKHAKVILRKQKRKPGIQSLFWGPPGTGKTEVIKQLARESGRDIVMYDAAKVTASAWGATEKFLRALFLGYSYLVAVSDRAPILMLNEADQLLSKRLSDVNSAVARSENTISNIVLQAFEDMEGILLATTNLAKNMDEAFDRRFLFKTELVKPDAPTRRKIWKSSIPELSDEESGRLAEMFDLSGGQISNVVVKRDLAELYYDGDRGFNYIMNLCKEEAEEPIKGTTRKVGF